MSEFRQDRTSGRWVIVAPNRKLRPAAASQARQAPARKLSPFDSGCPFCPGNEAQLPGIITEISGEAPPHWMVRVIPNKFPALQADAAAASGAGHAVRDGYGFHEVIVESPRHDADLASMTEAEIEIVLAAYRDRSQELLNRDGIEAVVMFRNHGTQSGASLSHPHAQAIALGLVPPMPARLAACGLDYFRAHGRCATCDEIEIELAAAQRIVEQTGQFAALVPFAASVPGEIWIVPRRHRASFVDIAEPELREFARLLRRTLTRLKRAHDDPPYNFVFDTATRKDRGSPHVHWRLRLAPLLTKWGGFELGADMPINTSSPEDDAALLRHADPKT